MFLGSRHGAAAAAMIAAALLGAIPAARAQEAAPAAKDAAAPAEAAQTEAVAPPVKQMKLTEAQIKGFVESQKDISALSDRIQAAGDNPDDALKKELDEVGKKHGFANFAELDDVAANISIVMAGLDPQTGEFNDPLEALKKELADIEADASIPEDEKKQLVKELNDAIKSTPPLENKENIDVVKAHREEIEKALQ